MSSQPSDCPECGQQGRWDDDDLWMHDNTEHALACEREGFDPYAGIQYASDWEYQ